MKKYRVNKIFYSIQGEGRRTGSPQVFLRFAGCNLKCSFCDTDHEPFEEMTAIQIFNECYDISHGCRNISFCGGEPTLQLDAELLTQFWGWYKSIETNGLKSILNGIDYVVCSPKTKPKSIKATRIDELRFVIGYGDPLPPWEDYPKAKRLYLSPMFDGEIQNPLATQHTITMVKLHPFFNLSIQSHKFINID